MPVGKNIPQYSHLDKCICFGGKRICLDILIVLNVKSTHNKAIPPTAAAFIKDSTIIVYKCGD